MGRVRHASTSLSAATDIELRHIFAISFAVPNGWFSNRKVA